MHSISAWHCQNNAPLCTPPSLGSLGAAAPNSAAPCAVLPAVALHQLRLSLDLRLPEWLCTKYSINYDIKRLIMTLPVFQAPLCLPHLKESMDRFSPGTSLCLHSQVAALVLCSKHTVISCCVTLCVCLCCVGKEQSFKWKNDVCHSLNTWRQ